MGMWAGGQCPEEEEEVVGAAAAVVGEVDAVQPPSSRVCS
jgi:hypothetical protein